MTSHASWRDRRISRTSEYQACNARGKRLHSRHFCICACFMAEKEMRFGITVSRKVGNAVTRNRVKRVLREFFRFNLPCGTGWQIVAIAKRDAQLLSLQEVSYELKPILQDIFNTVPA